MKKPARPSIGNRTAADELTPHQKAVLAMSLDDLTLQVLAGWDIETIKQTAGGEYSIGPLAGVER